MLDLFTCEKKIKEKTQAVMGAKGDKVIFLGVHIRRGDYKTWLNGKYFYEDDVYQDYIHQFEKLHPNKNITVYICSNDPTLNKAYFEEKFPNIKVVFPQGGQEDDLCLLSECDYLIGAPSTFSLVASMYHDIPLCWIEEKHTELTESSFKRFDFLFRNIK